MPTDYIYGETGSQAIYGLEATPGTQVPATKVPGVVQNVTPIDLGYEHKDGQSITTQQTLYRRAVKGMYAFSVEFFVQTWEFLYLIVGDSGYSVVDNLDGTYTHTLVMANELPSTTWEIINDDLGVSRVVVGCKIVSMECNVADGNEIKVKLDLVGRSADKDATPQLSTAVSDTTVPFFDDQVTIIDVNSVSRVTDALDLTWRVNRNSEARTTIGSKEPAFVHEKKHDHEIELDLFMQDMTVWDLVFNLTEYQTQFKAVRTASDDEITVTYPKCRTFKHNSDIPGDDLLKEAPLILPYNAQGSDVVTISITDGIADYST